MNHNGWSSSTIFAPDSAISSGVAVLNRNRKVAITVHAPSSDVATITIAFCRLKKIAPSANTMPTATPAIHTSTSRSAPNRLKKPATREYPSDPAISATANTQNRYDRRANSRPTRKPTTQLVVVDRNPSPNSAWIECAPNARPKKNP
jgi:hypothetical protein